MGILKHLVLTGSLMLVAVTSMANPTFSSDKTDVRLETSAQGLEHPWRLIGVFKVQLESRLRRFNVKSRRQDGLLRSNAILHEITERHHDRIPQAV